MALLAAGCSGSPLPATLGVSVGATTHPEPPVEIYSRIARGTLACWFGASGRLKPTHVFHADVAPPAAGGEAEIVIHERDKAAQTPRSLRSYRITITRAGDGSHVTIENLRFPEPMATDLKADVVRFATTGKSDCSVVGVGGWAAAPGKTEPPPPPAKAKLVKKKKQ